MQAYHGILPKRIEGIAPRADKPAWQQKFSGFIIDPMSMRPRAAFAKGMVRLGRLLQSLALMVMRPDDSIEFGRRDYGRSASLAAWAKDGLVDSGWEPEEKELLMDIPLREADVLVLGAGGGRDSIPFARLGHRVTAVDFVPGMVERAGDNARRRGLSLTGVVQEISRVGFPSESFDLVFLSAAMYSSVPTRRRRLAMLERIRGVLRPEGYFVCQFSWNPRLSLNPKAEFLKKLVAGATLGFRGYERGDQLWGNVEFQHFFSSRPELESEFAEGGFEIMRIRLPDGEVRGGAVLRRKGAAARPRD